MAMIQELQVGTPGRSSQIGGKMGDRVAMNRTQSRKRWILRTGLLLIAAGLVFSFMLAYWRDDNTVATYRRAMQVAVVALQEDLDQLDVLPAVPPTPGAPYAKMPSYASASVRFYAKHTTEPVIIARTPYISRVLGSSGVVVIVCENGAVQQKWLSRSDFQEAFQAQRKRIDAFEARNRSRRPNLPD